MVNNNPLLSEESPQPLQVSCSPWPEDTPRIGEYTPPVWKRKAKTLLIILAGIILVTGLTFAGYRLGQRSKPGPKESPLGITPTPTVSLTPTTSLFPKTITIPNAQGDKTIFKEQGFSISLPQNYLMSSFKYSDDGFYKAFLNDQKGNYLATIYLPLRTAKEPVHGGRGGSFFPKKNPQSLSLDELRAPEIFGEQLVQAEQLTNGAIKYYFLALEDGPSSWTSLFIRYYFPLSNNAAYLGLSIHTNLSLGECMGKKTIETLTNICGQFSLPDKSGFTDFKAFRDKVNSSLNDILLENPAGKKENVRIMDSFITSIEIL